MKGVAILPVLAIAGIALAGCQTTPTQDGAIIGGGLGAGLGAIVGNQSGHTGEGALIGAGVGALTGAIVGDAVDEGRKRRATTYYAPAPAPAPVPVAPSPAVQGHYETRIVQTPNGERYEERVWVPHR